MIVLALYGSVVGFSATPFLLADGTAMGAVIAGVFSTVNVLLTVYLTRDVRETKNAVHGAKRVSRESIEELKDVKRKVAGDRRTNPNKRRPGGQRRDD